MRVVIASHAEKTHFLGMVPLAWALRSAGHEVVVASQPALMPTVAATGLPAVAVGHDHGMALLARSVDSSDFSASPAVRLKHAPWEMPWPEMRDSYSDLVLGWLRMVNLPMVSGLTEFCRSYRPDLVIWEPITYAAPIAAEAVGALHVRHLWGLDLLARTRHHYLNTLQQQPPHQRQDPLTSWLTATADRVGTPYTERLTQGHLTLDPFPPPLRLDPIPGINHQPTRYIPYNGTATLPDWLRHPPTRPRVCLTLGATALDRLHPATGLTLNQLIHALARTGAEIVTALAPDQQATLTDLPPNVIPAGPTPLHTLLPTCDAVVHHGGVGTLCTAMVHAVPQLILPQLISPLYIYDEPLLAHNTALQGAALTINHPTLDPDTIHDHLHRLLNDPAHREAAQHLRDQAHAMPTPHHTTTQLQEAVEEWRG